MEIKEEKSCGCIIINENKVLLVKQTEGHWGFPKGHVEQGETEVQTAIREVKEETNIDVEVKEDKRYEEEYYPEENIKKQVVYFLAKNITTNIMPQQSEIQEIKWVPLNEAENVITYENSKNIIRKVINDLNLK